MLDRSRDLDKEIQHHLAEKVDLLIAEGWDRDEALREAARSFGDAGRVRQEMIKVQRESESTSWEGLRSVGSDLRYAVRGLRAKPGFAAAVVATLALGIGAVCSIFSVVDALILRPMPYRDADRWVEVNQAGSGSPGLAADRAADWREATEGMLDGWLAFTSTTLVRLDGSQAEALAVVAVTPGAERSLGIPVLLGRGFAPEDARPGAPQVAILAQEY